ncbi:hypothetical protein [Nostoc sp. UIC 10630]|uniref:hypothetical protein n=1 Tax=Nostoc sp. UIC 10630 TaxID=2100146 RepID=UPI0013D7836F|nr:hypothetical protein [Nostoc sp. UIC 10630]NEU80973.1 hypothetical protein [Nostoc sp. UIC 10630]
MSLGLNRNIQIHTALLLSQIVSPYTFIEGKFSSSPRKIVNQLTITPQPPPPALLGDSATI